MHYTSKYCDVPPYIDAYDAIKIVPILKAVTAYDNPDTKDTKILIFNESI